MNGVLLGNVVEMLAQFLEGERPAAPMLTITITNEKTRLIEANIGSGFIERLEDGWYRATWKPAAVGSYEVLWVGTNPDVAFKQAVVVYR